MIKNREKQQGNNIGTKYSGINLHQHGLGTPAPFNKYQCPDDIVLLIIAVDYIYKMNLLPRTGILGVSPVHGFIINPAITSPF